MYCLESLCVYNLAVFFAEYDCILKTVTKGFRKIQGLMCDETGKAYTGTIKSVSRVSDYKAGELAREELISSDGFKIVYDYDRNENIVTVANYDERGVLICRRDVVRDEKGKAIKSFLSDC